MANTSRFWERTWIRLVSGLVRAILFYERLMRRLTRRPAPRPPETGAIASGGSPETKAPMRSESAKPETSPFEPADRFVCLRCGGCCRGEGYVWLTDDDIERIARFLKLTRKEFVRRYTRRTPQLDDIALTDKNDAAISCIFLEDGGCAIHPVKPRQCAGFPFVWTRSDAPEFCEGIKVRAQTAKRKDA